jgi:hypothetical protein
MRRGRHTQLRDPISLESLGHGHSQDAEVQPERSMVDVPEIIPEPRFPADRIPAVDLRRRLVCRRSMGLGLA